MSKNSKSVKKARSCLLQVLTGSIVLLSFSSVADVPNVFAPGNPVVASEMNENFDSIDQRVSAFEPDFSGYGVPFAADGATKNVVVLKQVDPNDGSFRYYLRSRYANSTEEISIDGVPTIRPFIANYANVGTDSDGTINWISNYIDAPDTANYEVYNIEESEYDIGTLNKTVTDDTSYETFTCSGNVVLVCIGYERLNSDDSMSYIYDWSSNRVKAGPFEINGMTFNDVRMESFTGTSSAFRIRAKGIGEIYRRNVWGDGTVVDRSVIYYRSNGSTGGSLAGTPFDTGQPLEGLFF